VDEQDRHALAVRVSQLGVRADVVAVLVARRDDHAACRLGMELELDGLAGVGQDHLLARVEAVAARLVDAAAWDAAAIFQ
jgi:hypothetical protein